MIPQIINCWWIFPSMLESFSFIVCRVTGTHQYYILVEKIILLQPQALSVSPCLETKRSSNLNVSELSFSLEYFRGMFGMKDVWVLFSTRLHVLIGILLCLMENTVKYLSSATTLKGISVCPSQGFFLLLFSWIWTLITAGSTSL